jgi:NAD(P)-dependent dehydrogenase (short-subunit alcohol dehydrogenase family)
MTRPLTLVTGGTRGIGAATALRLAAAGHDLVLGYARDREAAEETAEAARARGVSVRTHQADVAAPAEVEGLFDAVAEWGRLTGLVNNAGATLHLGDLSDTPTDVIRRVIDVNLTGAVLCARRAVRDMRDGGVIVNVSSAAATRGAPHEYVHYAAAKAGLDALTNGLAQEVGPRRIRVYGVAPGVVRTRIHADAGHPGRPERVGDAVPLGRAGEPEEVAAAISWFMTEAPEYATGATLRMAGGR